MMPSDEKSTEVVICLGSSCFSRGNKSTVKTLGDYLKNHHLESRVFYHGGHCFGRCVEGPILQVGGHIFTHFEPESDLACIEKELNQQVKS